jgi:hypothetical protein
MVRIRAWGERRARQVVGLNMDAPLWSNCTSTSAFLLIYFLCSLEICKTAVYPAVRTYEPFSIITQVYLLGILHLSVLVLAEIVDSVDGSVFKFWEVVEILSDVGCSQNLEAWVLGLRQVNQPAQRISSLCDPMFNPSQRSKYGKLTCDAVLSGFLSARLTRSVISFSNWAALLSILD